MKFSVTDSFFSLQMLSMHLSLKLTDLEEKNKTTSSYHGKSSLTLLPCPLSPRVPTHFKPLLGQIYMSTSEANTGLKFMGIPGGVDTDQTAQEQSDRGLHCLPVSNLFLTHWTSQDSKMNIFKF